MGGGQAVEGFPLRPGQLGEENLPQGQGGHLGEAQLALEMGAEPAFQLGEESRFAPRRPGLAEEAREQLDPPQQLAVPVRPGQRAPAAQGVEQQCPARGRRWRTGAPRQRERPQAADLLRLDAARPFVPADFHSALEALGEERLERFPVHRRGGAHRPVGAPFRLGHHQELTARQGMVGGQPHPATRREPEAPLGAALGDPVGEGGGEQFSGAPGLNLLLRPAEPRPPAANGPPPARPGRTRRQGGGDKHLQVGLWHRDRLLEESHQAKAQRQLAEGGGPLQEHRQTGVGGMAGGPLPQGGEAAAAIDQAEFPEQAHSRFPGGRRRWGEPGELVGVAGAPAQHLEAQAGEVRFQDLREAVWSERLLGAPQAQAPARRLAPGAAPALVGAGAVDPAGDQAGQPGAGVVGGRALEPGVHHRANSGHGDAGFGHRGGEHHPAAIGAVAGEHRLLGGQRQAAVERLGGHPPAGQGAGEGRDLRPPRQEHQDVPLPLGEGPLHRVRLVGDGVVPGGRGQVVGADREGPPRAAHHRGVGAEEGLERGHVQGGGHDQKAQLGAERPLGVQGEGKPQIGLQRALVELVEDHPRHALEAGILLDEAQEHPLGEHFQAGGGGDAGLLPDAQPHGRPHRLAEARGEPAGGEPRRGAAGFEQQPAAAERGQEGRRHPARLAGAGFGHQQAAGVCAQGGE